ncbi:hypothetical protein RGQ29_024174 [Quercus rubra]|uniref:Uncharacterized protein n=1 Tax=Quercus rubra TaxID=3512 RepID=A0AAN7F7B7_QUERU|nr:hypothetical protein RGQ29_024174 [Quercus rubra]
MAHISDIKLIRTDTTLDLSQKAEKGMSLLLKCALFYSKTALSSFPAFMMWDVIVKLLLLCLYYTWLV